MFVFSLFALFNTQIVVVVVVVIGLRVCVYVCRAISVSIELDTDSSVFIRFFFCGFVTLLLLWFGQQTTAIRLEVKQIVFRNICRLFAYDDCAQCVTYVIVDNSILISFAFESRNV